MFSHNLTDGRNQHPSDTRADSPTTPESSRVTPSADPGPAGTAGFEGAPFDAALPRRPQDLSSHRPPVSAADFVGQWRVAYYTITTPTGVVFYPMGRYATGVLSYQADGSMSIWMKSSDRPGADQPEAERPGAWFRVKQHFLAALRACGLAPDSFSYRAAYEVAGDKVLHHVIESELHSWHPPGKTLQRSYAFTDEGLVLSSTGPYGGTHKLLWVRM